MEVKRRRRIWKQRGGRGYGAEEEEKDMEEKDTKEN